ncbi:hypothetical protein ACMFMG_012118 [Clarireedia jacksonii]
MTPHSLTQGSALAPVKDTVASIPLVRLQPSIVNLSNFTFTSNPTEQQHRRQDIYPVSVAPRRLQLNTLIDSPFDDAITSGDTVSAVLASLQHSFTIRGSFKIVGHDAGSWVPPAPLYHLGYSAHTDLETLIANAPANSRIGQMKHLLQQRPLTWNDQILEYPGEPLRNAEAAIAYTLGNEELTCVECLRGENPFPSCVYFPQALGGICTGCWYNGYHCTAQLPLYDFTDSFPNFKNPRTRVIQLPHRDCYGNPVEFRIYPNHRMICPLNVSNAMAVSLEQSSYIHGDSEMLGGNEAEGARKRWNEAAQDGAPPKTREE